MTVLMAESDSAFKTRTQWITQAACLSGEPEDMFVRGGAQKKAAAVCRRCPVALECLADALDNQIEFGVWGGLTERQRRALLKDHPEVTSWADFLDSRRRFKSQRRAGH